MKRKAETVNREHVVPVVDTDKTGTTTQRRAKNGECYVINTDRLIRSNREMFAAMKDHEKRSRELVSLFEEVATADPNDPDYSVDKVLELLKDFNKTFHIMEDQYRVIVKGYKSLTEAVDDLTRSVNYYWFDREGQDATESSGTDV